MTNQYVVTDENTALVLEMTAVVHKYILPEMDIPSEVSIERWEHI